jgi:hypothetical protein
MKYICEIEYPDDCGPGWMNKYNLESCLFSDTHISNVNVSVKDHVCSLPQSICEALNTGDGVYRP